MYLLLLPFNCSNIDAQESLNPITTKTNHFLPPQSIIFAEPSKQSICKFKQLQIRNKHENIYSSKILCTCTQVDMCTGIEQVYKYM